jgi:hypothetical protein
LFDILSKHSPSDNRQAETPLRLQRSAQKASLRLQRKNCALAWALS